MIDRARALESQFAERYVAGQLSPAEAREFEEAMLEYPEVLQQVELARTMKLGLRALRQRGELAALTGHRASGVPWWLSAAAALVVCAIAITWVARRDAAAILMASPGRPATASSAREYLVARTRGAEVTDIEAAPGEPRVALRILVPVSRATTIHRVELLRGDDSLSTLNVVPDRDYIHLLLDTSRLPSGDYRLRITAGDASAAETIYPLRLRRGS